MSLISIIIGILHEQLHKPKYLLDENISKQVLRKPSCKYIKFNELLINGTPDEKVLDKAIEKKLIVITRDVKFIIYALSKNQNIIYETSEGTRFLFDGKKTKTIHQDEPKIDIYRLNNKQKRFLDFSNRLPFTLPLDGFYQVYAI